MKLGAARQQSPRAWRLVEVEVYIPTSDGRTLILSRYTQPEPDPRSGRAQDLLGFCTACRDWA